MTLRRIEPMNFEGLKKPAALGQRPRLHWTDPKELLVDESYQRELGSRSRWLIRRIAEGFAWARMKPPIAVTAEGGFHVVDGQHTAIAAATIGLSEIPIIVVSAVARAERARAFVGHNNDRIKVGPFSVHKALLAAGDEIATDIANVCRRAGVRLRSSLNANTMAEIGDTTAVRGIAMLIRRRGVMKARQVLEALVKGERAPITTHEIYAAELVLFERLRGCTVDGLASVIAAGGDREVIGAKAAASLEKKPVRELLAARWIRRIERAA